MGEKDKPEEPRVSRDERHKLLDELVTMPMAATLAYIKTAGTNARVGDAELDGMARSSPA